MGTSTAVLQLFKPSGSESADITQINDNMDKLEAAHVAVDTRIDSLENPVTATTGMKWKTSDETVTSSTVEQGDNQLVINVTDGLYYFIDYWLLVAAGDTTTDFSVDFLFPLGDCYVTNVGPNSASLPGESSSSSESEWISRTTEDGTVVTSTPFGLSGSRVGIRIHVSYLCKADGVFRLRWSQRNSDADAVTVYKGSTMEWRSYAS